MKKIAALMLCFCFLCGCGTEDKRELQSAKINEYIKIEAREDEAELWIGCDALRGEYCSLWSECDGDTLISELINAHLLTKDRSGDIVYNAVEGELRPYRGADYEYRGIADLTIEKTADGGAEYTWSIAQDVYFSDGEQLTADDVIFTLALVCDEAYDGSCGLGKLDIKGLRAYNAGVDEKTYEKYKALAMRYLAAPSADAGETERWLYNTAMPQAWREECVYICGYCLPFAEEHAEEIGLTAEKIENDPSCACAFALYMWGFASYDSGFLTGVGTGRSIKPENADMDFFVSEAQSLYPDAEEFMEREAVGTERMSITENAVKKFISHFGKAESETAGIAGIEKIDGSTVKISTESYKFTDIYAMDIPILPLHYCADETKFDPDGGMYGFERGDIAKIKEKCLHPVGAGVYCIYEENEGNVKLRANTYSREKPKTSLISVTESENGCSCISSGRCDVYFGSDNSGKYYSCCENTGYGYIGINCDNVSVGGEPYSESSRELRAALSAVIASCKIEAAEYYNGAAVESDLCICRDSWAYSEKGTACDKDTAISIAIGKLRDAGYEWDADEGKFTAAPEGAKLEYTVMIPGNGKGGHPAYNVIKEAAKLFEYIGIELKISDLTDMGVLHGALEDGTAELWAAAWTDTAVPDLYQLFNSENIPANGTGLNYYRLSDKKLDDLLSQARSCVSSAVRREIYAECLDIIYSQAAEIPLYRKLDAFYCGNRVDGESVALFTAYYPACNIIKDINMK